MKKGNKEGRPKVPDLHKRRNHTITTTDTEWQNLQDKADKAGYTKSEYIVKKLGL